MSDDEQKQTDEQKEEEQQDQNSDNNQDDNKTDDDKKEEKQPAKTKDTEEEKEKEDKKKQYFTEELKRLQTSLKKEASKIKAPEPKQHTPYIFNTLEPYYNTKTAKFIIEQPEEPEEKKHSFVSRQTAIGLCDPWTDHRMDVEFLPRTESKPQPKFKQQGLRKADGKKHEGSTRLPKYPEVKMETQELATKTLYYNDVPKLRQELREKYHTSAQGKIDADYKRTKDDFYRMDLDKMEEVHPLNRDNMKAAYFAYLQNTPGSKKAVNECVKGLKASDSPR